MRTFIAIALPPELADELHGSAQEMHRLVGRALRVPPPENLHLTLKFLGQLAPDRLPTLSAALRRELAAVSAIEVRVQGYGAFPRPDRARVLWAGAADPGDALPHLAQAADRAAVEVGIEPERRPFRPHITIGRCRRPCALPMGKFLQRVDGEAVRRFTADAVTVFRSEAGPAGAVYTPVASIPLG